MQSGFSWIGLGQIGKFVTEILQYTLVEFETWVFTRQRGPNKRFRQFFCVKCNSFAAWSIHTTQIHMQGSCMSKVRLDHKQVNTRRQRAAVSKIKPNK